MNPNANLSRAERVARLGELLSKGVTLMLAQEVALKEGSKRPEEKPMAATGNTVVVNNTAADEIEAAILHYLKRVGNASPHDIQSAMDLSKATAFRRLQQMVQSGTVIRTGKTAAIRYRLAAKNTDMKDV